MTDPVKHVAPGEPVRIQRKRTKGWKMPENAVYVGRPTKWGNPYKLGDFVHRGPSFSGRDEYLATPGLVVEAYRKWMFHAQRSEGLITELRGKDLACWCPLDQPCHADVLLELANKSEEQ